MADMASGFTHWRADMAPSGPLPTGTAIRRNKPTIPTTNLPVSGRRTDPPAPPDTYELGPAALDWWGWAWRTPQACAWDDGALFTVARRAQLEDDLVALDSIDLDVAELLEIPESALTRQLGFVFGRIKSLAGGRMGVIQKINDLDMQLGLSPKGLAALRWKIVPDDQAAPSAPTPTAPKKPKTKGRALTAVPAAS